MTERNVGFLRGTWVHTPSGVAPIETVRAGELVLSRDVRKGLVSRSRVLRVVRDDHCYIDCVRVSNLAERLYLGTFQKVWTTTSGWVEPGNLRDDFTQLLDDTSVALQGGEDSCLWKTNVPGIAWKPLMRGADFGSFLDFRELRMRTWDLDDPEMRDVENYCDDLFALNTHHLEIEGTRTFLVRRDGVVVSDASGEAEAWS